MVLIPYPDGHRPPPFQFTKLEDARLHHECLCGCPRLSLRHCDYIRPGSHLTSYGAAQRTNAVKQKRSLALNPVDANFLLALTYLYSIIPICSQSILLIRVLAVYPPRQLTWARRFLIYGTLAALQTARVVNIILDFVKTTQTIHATKNFIEVELSVWKVPYVKVEIILQLAYDVYVHPL